MSGTSLDGLDIAYCTFQKKDNWTFSIKKASTVEYSEELKQELRLSAKLSALDFVKLHKKLGNFIGNEVNKFSEGLNVDFIASHGHTSIHLPEISVNFQLGDGATIAAITKTPVICDFRSLDIALKGQGAPLVPIGDKLLFSDFDSFLNIGGFANVSFMKQKILAYDISPANFALNYYSRKLGFEFDKDGRIGESNTSNDKLVEKLDSLFYYSQKSPKSLSDHWFYDVFLKEIEKFELSFETIITSLYEHISTQIAKELDKNSAKKCLVTGGGALNGFLISKIKEKSSAEIIIPDKLLIEYKEALVFAFLGVLRWIKEPNCLASVTGAEIDNIGGAVYFV